LTQQRNDPAAAPAALKAGLAARYRVEHELGRGGMATVYHAWDLQHDRPVALKVLHADIARTIGTERFQREIRLSARLQHPHILTVLDSGETDGQFWFTMPFIDGESLAARLKRNRQLPLEEALRITREVADALQQAGEHPAVGQPRPRQ
jgi:serine/threonine-protein kinase